MHRFASIFIFGTATCIPLFLYRTISFVPFQPRLRSPTLFPSRRYLWIHCFFFNSIFHPPAYRTADYDLSVSLYQHRCADHLEEAVSQFGNAVGLSDTGHPTIIGRYGFQSSSGRHPCLRIGSLDTQFIHPHPFLIDSDFIHDHRLMATVLLCRSGIRSSHILCYFLWIL